VVWFFSSLVLEELALGKDQDSSSYLASNLCWQYRKGSVPFSSSWAAFVKLLAIGNFPFQAAWTTNWWEVATFCCTPITFYIWTAFGNVSEVFLWQNLRSCVIYLPWLTSRQLLQAWFRSLRSERRFRHGKSINAINCEQNALNFSIMFIFVSKVIFANSFIPFMCLNNKCCL
jgi:hypothetical protein